MKLVKKISIGLWIIGLLFSKDMIKNTLNKLDLKKKLNSEIKYYFVIKKILKIKMISKTIFHIFSLFLIHLKISQISKNVTIIRKKKSKFLKNLLNCLLFLPKNISFR